MELKAFSLNANVNVGSNRKSWQKCSSYHDKHVQRSSCWDSKSLALWHRFILGVAETKKRHVGLLSHGN